MHPILTGLLDVWYLCCIGRIFGVWKSVLIFINRTWLVHGYRVPWMSTQNINQDISLHPCLSKKERHSCLSTMAVLYASHRHDTLLEPSWILLTVSIHMMETERNETKWNALIQCRHGLYRLYPGPFASDNPAGSYFRENRLGLDSPAWQRALRMFNIAPSPRLRQEYALPWGVCTLYRVCTPYRVQKASCR